MGKEGNPWNRVEWVLKFANGQIDNRINEFHDNCDYW
jgi:hypothetical protein